LAWIDYVCFTFISLPNQLVTPVVEFFFIEIYELIGVEVVDERGCNIMDLVHFLAL
jgi:hypothetical protein